MEKLGFDGRNNVLLIVLADLPKIVNGFWREDNAKHREPHVQHHRTRRVCCLEYIILSDVRILLANPEIGFYCTVIRFLVDAIRIDFIS